LSGCGKNTVGRLVAEKLNLRIVDPTFKTIAKKEKMALLDFHKKAEKEHKIDKEFDRRLIADADKGDCVVTTWLGPWMIKKADLRVWLHAPAAIRAKRISGRDGMKEEEALAHIEERDSANRARYKAVYGIDIYDHSGFDLVINSAVLSPEQSSETIAAAAKAKMARAKKSSGKK